MVFISRHFEIAQAHRLYRLWPGGPSFFKSVLVHVLRVVGSLDGDLHRILADFRADHLYVVDADFALDGGGCVRSVVTLKEVDIANGGELFTSQDREEQDDKCST